jgi:hypothetical protein
MARARPNSFYFYGALLRNSEMFFVILFQDRPMIFCRVRTRLMLGSGSGAGSRNQLSRVRAVHPDPDPAGRGHGASGSK